MTVVFKRHTGQQCAGRDIHSAVLHQYRLFLHGDGRGTDRPENCILRRIGGQLAHRTEDRVNKMVLMVA